jgi:hypothetical protein
MRAEDEESTVLGAVSRHTTSEITANCEHLVLDTVNCKVPKLAKALELLVITIPKVFSNSNYQSNSRVESLTRGNNNKNYFI